MYLTAYVLGPTEVAEYSVCNYEARRQRELEQVAERQEAAQPAQKSSAPRRWYVNLIPALQR